MGDPSKYTRRRQEQLAEERGREGDGGAWTWVPVAASWNYWWLYVLAWPAVLFGKFIGSWSRHDPPLGGWRR